MGISSDLLLKVRSYPSLLLQKVQATMIGYACKEAWKSGSRHKQKNMPEPVGLRELEKLTVRFPCPWPLCSTTSPTVCSNCFLKAILLDNEIERLGLGVWAQF